MTPVDALVEYKSQRSYSYAPRIHYAALQNYLVTSSFVGVGPTPISSNPASQVLWASRAVAESDSGTLAKCSSPMLGG